MPLIIEDGSGVPGAQSYVTAAEAVAWVTARGLTLAGTEAEVEQRLLTAMDMVESYRSQFSGVKSSGGNQLQWPRMGVLLDGEPLEDNTIPTELKSALICFAYESQTTELQPTVSSQTTAKEKVDVIEVEYFNAQGRPASTPTFTKALAFLQPLLKSAGSFGVKLVRV